MSIFVLSEYIFTHRDEGLKLSAMDYIANKALKLEVKVEAKDKLIAELKELLFVAKCPQCDGGGAFYDNDGEIHQCQWCHESKLLTNKE